MRGRNFAASVVVTLSLAELAAGSGCTSSDGKGAKDGAKQVAKDAEKKEPEPENPARNPPAVRPDMPEATGGSEVAGATEGGEAPTGAGEGEAPVPDTADAKPETPEARGRHLAPNPPPPNIRRLKELGAVDPFPPPKNQSRSGDTTIMLQGDGTCISIKDDRCKPGAHCNPPKPKNIACPIEFRLPKARKPERVIAGRNQTCWEPTPFKKVRRVVCPKPKK